MPEKLKKILPWFGWVLGLGAAIYAWLSENPAPSEAAELAGRLLGG